MSSLREMMSRSASLVAASIALAPLTLAVPLLLPGCGGGAPADAMYTPSSGGAATKSAEDELKASDKDAGFMRVGAVYAAPIRPVTAAPPPPPSDEASSTGAPKPADARHRPKTEWQADPSTALSDPTAAASATATAAASASPAPERGHGKSSGAVQGAVVDSAGGLSEAEVRTTIVQQQAVFRACYELGVAATSSGFSGTVALRATIGPTGTVASVDVLSSSTKLLRVDACVADAVRRIQFPAKGGSAVVGFPIEFGK